ncbi:MAG: dipeptidase [Rhodothermales bacterium]
MRAATVPFLPLLVVVVAAATVRGASPVGPVEYSPPSDTLETDGGAIRMSPIRARVLIRGDTLWERALRIHYDAIVVDGHVDVPSLMVDDAYDFRVRHPSHAAHVDLPRMYEGGLDAAFFSVYIAHHYGEGHRAVARALLQIEAVKRQVEAVPDSAELALTADDVRRIATSGRKAVLLGLEGGNALAASVDTLKALYEAGIRYVTLTHVNNNSWAESSQSPPRWGGLTDHGRALVKHMNRLGVAVDLSHVSDATFYDALDASNAPVLLSHSSARALVDNVRNVDDDMLRALADNGGLVMINFFDAVVNPHLTEDVMAEAYERLGGRRTSLNDMWSVIYDLIRERELPGATLSDVVDHIEHAVDVAGVDHVGLGSDFDGIFDVPAGLQDVTRLPWITYELLRRGYSEEDINKILGGNVLRVMDEVERVASGETSSRSSDQ